MTHLHTVGKEDSKFFCITMRWSILLVAGIILPKCHAWFPEEWFLEDQDVEDDVSWAEFWRRSLRVRRPLLHPTLQPPPCPSENNSMD